VRVQSTHRAPGESAYMLLRVQRRSGDVMPEHGFQADPVGVQLGARLAHSAPLAMEKCVHIERRIPFQHVIDRSCQLVGQDGQGLALAVLFLQPAQVFLSGRIGP
jgi:hypothetical protein